MSAVVNVSTARLTLGSVLGTVNEVATSVSSVFSTGTAAVGIVNRYVEDAATKQKIRSIIEMNDYSQKFREEKAMEATLRKKQIVQFCNESEENKELFKAEYDRLGNLLQENGF